MLKLWGKRFRYKREKIRKLSISAIEPMSLTLQIAFRYSKKGSKANMPPHGKTPNISKDIISIRYYSLITELTEVVICSRYLQLEGEHATP
jgi:hypothetical protein